MSFGQQISVWRLGSQPGAVGVKEHMQDKRKIRSQTVDIVAFLPFVKDYKRHRSVYFNENDVP